jgi:cell division protein FtsI (penicillin-binding protein 3)
MDSKFRNRFFVALGALGVIGLALVVRYGLLMLSPSDPLPAGPASVERGPILDRNGLILAASSPKYNIAVYKPDIPDGFPQEDRDELAALLGIGPVELEAKIASSATDFFYVQKRAPAESAKALRAGKDKGRFRGVIVEEQDGRSYPLGSLAAHVVGYVGDENRGLSGIEYAQDAALSPEPPPGAPRDYVGNQVILTIDSGAQNVLERIAREVREKNGAQAVMFLAMDPRSGDILGYASEPSFDPSDIGGADPDSLLNMPISYPYEPGSVFKVFSLSGMMQLGGIDENSVFTCDGAYHNDQPGKEAFTIKCLGVHGRVTPQRILSLSCNAGAAYASDTVSMIDFYSAVKSFGFGDRTGIGLGGEETGVIRPVGQWSLRTKPTIAMGQECLVTAVQMLQAASAVAHGGMLMKPRLVSRIVGSDGRLVWENPVVPVRRVLDEATARKTLGFMETVVAEGGTGTRARVQGLRMAVKTGTAQMVDKGAHFYSETSFIASCLAILPAEDPELVLYMAIIKPRGESYYGGRIAAPPVGQAADELANLLGIGRAGADVEKHGGTISIYRGEKAEIGAVMPDLTGKPKRLLLPLLSRTDIAVVISGDGYVVRQAPAPGTPVKAGDKITLELE